LPRALPARYVPPSGFGYPPGGLRPSRPCRFCFAPAALLGFAPSEHDTARGIQASPPGSTHLPFHPQLRQPHEAEGRIRRPRLLGFDPLAGSGHPHALLTRRGPEAPVGLTLSGYTREGLSRDFAQLPLTRFTPAAVTRGCVGTSEYQSALAWTGSRSWPRRTTQNRTTLIGFGTGTIRIIQAGCGPGY